MKIIITLSIIALFVIMFAPQISAETGCCFNPSTGFCSMNSESENCVLNGGEYSESPSCSISKCALGCCILGKNTRMATSRECELLSKSAGFESAGNFQMIDEQSCILLSKAEELGACLSGEYAPYGCKISTREKCQTGRFYFNLSCTASELDTECRKTSNKICYPEKNGNVYIGDSCGNPDELIAECDYKSGTICSQSGIKTECKKLSCYDLKNRVTRANGESWCSYEKTEYSGDAADANSKWVLEPVGSRFSRKYCLNGEIIIEPCADYRMEYCTEGKCTLNPFDSCLSAGTESKYCDLANCFVFNSAPGCGNPQHQPDIDYPFCKINGIITDLREMPIEEVRAITGFKNINSAEELPAEFRPALKLEILNDKEKSLRICMPAYAGGFDFWGSSTLAGNVFGTSSNSKTDSGNIATMCSYGDFSAEITFSSQNYPGSGNEAIWLDLKGKDLNKYGWAGLFDLNPTHWSHTLIMHEGTFETKVKAVPDGTGNMAIGPLLYGAISFPNKLFCLDENPLAEYREGISDSTGCLLAREVISGEGMPIDSWVVQFLEERCMKIADCAGKANWIGKSGSVDSGGEFTQEKTKNGVVYSIPCEKTGSSETSCKIEFSCEAFRAPYSGDDCGRCGANGTVCSEYRCKALGQACEYKSPEGADNGYCIASSDNRGPELKFQSMNPASPVSPYAPIEFKLTTNEVAECKFNLEGAGEKYEDMKYNFGEGYGTEHTAILHLPGKIIKADEKVSAYSAIKEGKNTLYVRCSDLAGNINIAPLTIDFEVMQMPKLTEPVLSDFAPASGSMIKFNTTEKLIKFGVDAPSECKWSFNDKDFNEMENRFECDFAGGNTLINGYFCSGTLTNITTNLNSQTKFYIRCKDQPWLEGNETDLYKRNTNRRSYEYVLQPSEELKITAVSPSGMLLKSGANLSVDLTTVTSGGSANGKAICKWRLSVNSSSTFSFVKFLNTNSNIHRQPITSNLSETDYYLQVRCNDTAENIAEKDSSFSIKIDRSAPIIKRIYESANLLKLKTDEHSKCYYSSDKKTGCSFSFANATIMSGADKEHTAPWKEDTMYYIRCQDFFGNDNAGCAIMARTY